MFGEQHPHEYQVLLLARIRRFTVGGEPVGTDPASGLGDVPVGQPQPDTDRADPVAQLDRLGHHVLGLVDRGGRGERVTLGVPDPGECQQAVDQRWGVGEPPAVLDPDRGVLVGQAEFVTFVQHLGHTHVRHAD